MTPDDAYFLGKTKQREDIKRLTLKLDREECLIIHKEYVMTSDALQFIRSVVSSLLLNGSLRSLISFRCYY
jgi:hypothetical protein